MLGKEGEVVSVLLNYWFTMAQFKLKEFFTDEDGAVDLVTIVILIGIAVVLAVVFRKQIGDLLNGLYETINGKAQEAVS